MRTFRVTTTNGANRRTDTGERKQQTLNRTIGGRSIKINGSVEILQEDGDTSLVLTVHSSHFQLEMGNDIK